ncbi:amidoligase family protein [Qingshengfaniella alkalisoli]|nr:amidoligase family protein [Qingshengfaniella alkalisoli]
MPPSLPSFPHDRFWPLPQYGEKSATSRRVGLEIEFSGLTEAQTAKIVTGRFGGDIRTQSPYEVEIENTEIGKVKIELDSAYAKADRNAVLDAGLDLARSVIPTEIVTQPLSQGQLGLMQSLCADLAKHGAQGSRTNLLRGFGMHINPEIAGQDTESIVPVMRAYALMEDWLREADPIDPSRRMMPFVDPYPSRLIDALARYGDLPKDEVFRIYLDLADGRNHGLDVLPVIVETADASLADRVRRNRQVKGRPAWHYRLPDCRIDEPDWSIAAEWNRWVLVERAACMPELVEELAEAWLKRRKELTSIRLEWWRAADEVIRGYDLFRDKP